MKVATKKKVLPISVKVGNVTLKIYKGTSHGYPLHTLVWYEAGKRQRRTFSELQEAKDEAQILGTRIESGNRTAAKMKNTDADAMGLALRDLQPLGIPLNVAVKEYVAARKILDGGSIVEAARFYAARRPTQTTSISVHDAVEAFLVAKEADGVGVRYKQDARSRLRRLAKAFAKPISGVTTAEIDEWLRRIAVHPRTRNNFRQHIVTLFRWARDQGHLPREAQTEADRLPLARDAGKDVEIFTPSQLEALLKASDERLRPYIAIRAFAGVRDSEMRRLTWANVRFDQHVIEIRAGQAKTANRRLIPILPNLAAWLSPYKSEEESISYANAERIARRTAKEAGIPWVHNGLRHGFGSHRLAVLKNAAQVAHEMGNTERMVHGHYKELVTEAEGVAWFAIMPG